MEPRKCMPKKPFVSKEQNNCEEEINLTPQDSNIDWCKSGFKCKPMVTFAKSFCLLAKSLTTREAFPQTYRERDRTILCVWSICRYLSHWWLVFVVL